MYCFKVKAKETERKLIKMTPHVVAADDAWFRHIPGVHPFLRRPSNRTRIITGAQAPAEAISAPTERRCSHSTPASTKPSAALAEKIAGRCHQLSNAVQLLTLGGSARLRPTASPPPVVPRLNSDSSHETPMYSDFEDNGNDGKYGRR